LRAGTCTEKVAQPRANRKSVPRDTLPGAVGRATLTGDPASGVQIEPPGPNNRATYQQVPRLMHSRISLRSLLRWPAPCW